MQACSIFSVFLIIYTTDEDLQIKTSCTSECFPAAICSNSYPTPHKSHLYSILQLVVLRWSFGVVLWEIATLGEQMRICAQHQWFIVTQTCLALMAPTCTLPLPFLLRWPPISLHRKQSPPYSPVERIPHGKASQLFG